MAQTLDPKGPAHFKGKDAIEHVAEAQAQGIIASAEIHGTEIPGHIAAACDAARETSVILILTWALLNHLSLPPYSIFLFLCILGGSWIVWKGGRSAWLGWSRLERLHRVVAQEKWEIEHHRIQEREELKALYAAKGFEGKLLEDVLDVLMADGDRLLRVMVEEELGLSLESHEHPLKQCVGAALGSFFAAILCVLGVWVFPPYGILFMAVFSIGIAAALSAYHEKNKIIPAIVWNLALGALSFGFVHFMLLYVSSLR